MQKATPPPVTDPRGEISRYCNQIAGIYSEGGVVHVDFAVLRPLTGEPVRQNMPLEVQIVARLAFNREIAGKLADALKATVRGDMPSTDAPQN